MAINLPRRLAAEALGTAVLVATVVGSGIMADRLSDDAAVSLLGNTLPTGAILVVLITTLGPISGAHFNPAVTLVFALRREIEANAALAYVAAQIIGGVAGTFLAHAMFELPILQFSTTVRTGAGQWIAEAVAAFGLVFTILAGLRFRADAVPWLVGLYITAAYWFTASTSFANPAVAIARALSDTFAGIRPTDLPGFIAAELLGALLAMAFAGWLLAQPQTDRTDESRRMTDHDLPQSRMRHVPQHARHDPAVRRGAGSDRISEDAAFARKAGRTDRRDEDDPARPAAQKGHALRRAWPRRSEMDGRPADRFDARRIRS